MKWVPSAPSTGNRGAGAGAGRLAEAAERRRHHPRKGRGGRPRFGSRNRRGGGLRHRIDCDRDPARRPPARIRHQRQQEAGRDHEAEHRHHHREDLLRRGEPVGVVVRRRRQRHEMHAVHRGVVHAGHRDAECDRACDQPDAVLPGQERAQAAIGRDDRNQNRQQNHRRVVLDGEIAGEAVNADIMHAGDARPPAAPPKRSRAAATARRCSGKTGKRRPPARRSGTRRWWEARDRRYRPGSAPPACRRNAWSRCRRRGTPAAPDSSTRWLTPGAPRMRAARPKPV